MNRNLVKLISIILACVIVVGVVGAAVVSFAVTPDSALATAALPATGESNLGRIAIVAAVIAVVALIGTTVLPKFMKK